MRTLAILVGTAASLATMLGAGGAALADQTIYSTGFEGPTYHLGALAGQNGWTGNSGVVENTTAYAGTQAVEYNADGVTGGALGDLTMISVSGGGPLMQVNDEFYATAADSNVAWTVLSFGGNAGAFIGALFVSSAGVNVSGKANSAAIPITFGAWNSYTVDINFTTDTLTGYVNGALIASEAFAQSSTELTEVGFGIDGANGKATSQAYVDNLSVADVPEPATLMLSIPGLVAVAAFRRRQRRARAAA